MNARHCELVTYSGHAGAMVRSQAVRERDPMLLFSAAFELKRKIFDFLYPLPLFRRI